MKTIKGPQPGRGEDAEKGCREGMKAALLRRQKGKGEWRTQRDKLCSVLLTGKRQREVLGDPGVGVDGARPWKPGCGTMRRAGDGAECRPGSGRREMRKARGGGRG